MNVAERARKLSDLLQSLRRSGLASTAEEAERMAERILGKDVIEEFTSLKPIAPKTEGINSQAAKGEAAAKELPKMPESSDAPKADKNSPDYDVTKEHKTLKELMDEDAETVYNSEKKEENA